jgi:magnesium transporter
VELFSDYVFVVLRAAAVDDGDRSVMANLAETEIHAFAGEFVIGRKELSGDELAPYYRDVVDHVIRADELLDNVRDLLTSLQELRVAQAANRVNEVMKSLTAWATILLVPTLFAGIWGMNFRHMPELEWRCGYAFAVGTIVASALGLYAWFKWKKRWL